MTLAMKGAMDMKPEYLLYFAVVASVLLLAWVMRRPPGGIARGLHGWRFIPAPRQPGCVGVHGFVRRFSTCGYNQPYYASLRFW